MQVLLQLAAILLPWGASPPASASPALIPLAVLEPVARAGRAGLPRHSRSVLPLALRGPSTRMHQADPLSEKAAASARTRHHPPPSPDRAARAPPWQEAGEPCLRRRFPTPLYRQAAYRRLRDGRAVSLPRLPGVPARNPSLPAPRELRQARTRHGSSSCPATC